MTLLDLVIEGMASPSLIIAMPVGFIGVIESKKRLASSGLNYILLKGTRGGAGLAAAASASTVATASAAAAPAAFAGSAACAAASAADRSIAAWAAAATGGGASLCASCLHKGLLKPC